MMKSSREVTVPMNALIDNDDAADGDGAGGGGAVDARRVSWP